VGGGAIQKQNGIQKAQWPGIAVMASLVTPILFLLLKTHRGVFRHDPGISVMKRGAMVTSRCPILISKAFTNLSTTFHVAFS
jgi:hypothetical protein